jgi:hypothetical protein
MTEQGQRPDLPARPAGDDAEDDAAVIRRSRDEPEHFAVLFRRYAPGVQRYVRRRVGPPAIREFDAIEDMITSYVMPPQLTAELYRALGDIPGVTVDEHAVDVAGRPGIATATPS